ncbi:distinct helicase family with a unique C-terminal domain including a metal-binding cysteine cluster [Bellilinea caldifistulae]|uniref:DEAD/DEAH box helicase n=1 Tax=Bellilinea caldifistulae TaxID=360411 RepID=A0A0P6WZY1_9CHLR|nr:DEAD/DEAH box helicase [Bellilinea caldifistulae]KPL72452.1 hypothetical protein AC812_15665 [Bellilinea caldifistulae]GAP10846.1 distinct helicase family with a unique C-terminal domain including a metal-binding cysteine cluster [Bellilinea caldifistulae]
MKKILDFWQNDPSLSPNISTIHVTNANPGHFVPLPEKLDKALVDALLQENIKALYRHQWEAIQNITQSKHTIITTGTASGKSLCYLLPILDKCLKDNTATSLLLFPTKALTQDQLNTFLRLSPSTFHSSIAIYDGDTPSSQRAKIRQTARILLSNPDMLHTAILPHHPNWERFFRGLTFVVLDEVHLYRGVFGSHIANLIRRLKRVGQFYSASPIFILTSATVANAKEHAENLIEEPFQQISDSQSPRGTKYFLLYNPPIVHEELGVRRSALSEAVRMSGDLIVKGIQTLLFTHTRKNVEIGMKLLQSQNPDKAHQIFAYRSGYLPTERRKTEEALKTGKAKAVVATNALELGIDIGGMEAVIISGYPGSIAATHQQAGRAGRQKQDSLAVLVASSNPLDQYILKHPEYLFENPPEMALINPNNPLILYQHIRCAVFELPFRQNDTFGKLPWEDIHPYLQVLTLNREVFATADRFIWRANQYPSQNVSLRSTSGDSFLLQVEEDDRLITIGELDQASVDWMAHPNAIYLHQGQTFIVQELDFEKKLVRLSSFNGDYYTQPLMDQTIRTISEEKNQSVPGGAIHFGEIEVTRQLKGFRKISWLTKEILATEELELPPRTMRTVGYWIELDAVSVQKLSEYNLWSGKPNNYGPNWEKQRKLARQRDQYTCQLCGIPEKGTPHHVHHKIPFRQFPSYEQANRLENLITLCPVCHHKAESVVRIRTGLSGLRFLLSQIAPLFVLCDPGDLGSHSDPQSPISQGNPIVMLYDNSPAGIGLSETLFEKHEPILNSALEVVQNCPCGEGCPSCVGVGGENGSAGKVEAIAILKILNGQPLRL